MSIEQSMCTLEDKIEERTPARRGEASHSQAVDAATEDLRQELGSLREQVFQELDGMRSKVVRSNPQPTKTVATNPGTAQSEADLPGDVSKACSPGGDEEAFIENAWVRAVQGTPRPSVRLERNTPHVPSREEQPSKKCTKKRKCRRRRRQRKKAVGEVEASTVTQQFQCTRASNSNFLVGDSLVTREVFLSAMVGQ